MSKKSETRYFLFNRNTLAKTKKYTVVKNAETREQAREARRNSAQNLGIYDRWAGEAIS